ncbi:hypothetical protein QMO14_24355 [Variovorax sp. CAN2819]|nr:hypothetical protein [Variovorax sp. CAN15]MDN6886726.1 hypothetical protein [Variovorax sp. CAN15]
MPVLPSLEPKPHDIHLSYLPARRNTPRIRTFVDYFLDLSRAS